MPWTARSTIEVEILTTGLTTKTIESLSSSLVLDLTSAISRTYLPVLDQIPRIFLPASLPNWVSGMVLSHF